MAIEAILFDLDNTLVNRKRAFRTFADKFIERFVYVSDPRKREAMIGYMEATDDYGQRNLRQLLEELMCNFDMKEPGVRMGQLVQFWNDEFSKCTEPMAGAVGVLQALKAGDKRLGLVANGSAREQYAVIDAAQLRVYFDVIVVSDEAGAQKPDRRIFDIALQRLGICPARVWHVGDHPVEDIQGARSAGILPVWMKGFSPWNPTVKKPRHSIGQLEKLLALIEDVAPRKHNERGKRSR